MDGVRAYTLHLTTRYLNSANYVTSDAPLVMASTPVENGVATIQFTGARRGVELRMFVSDLAAEVPLYQGATAVKVDVFTFGSLARTQFLVSKTYSSVEIRDSVGVTSSYARCARAIAARSATSSARMDSCT